MTRDRLVKPEGTVLTWWNISTSNALFPFKRYEVRAHFLVTRGTVTKVEAAERGALAETIEGARQLLPRGLRHLPRPPDNDPPVVEVWL